MTRLSVFLVLLAASVALPSAVHAQPAQRLVLDTETGQHTINRHIYGHFAEHLGRGIYDGVWRRNAQGQWEMRPDIIAALRQIRVPNVRWPGGCFADYYHWRDGIGPLSERPTIVNNMWGGVTEDNGIGTHEFLAFTEALGAEPVVVGNVGSGTVQEMSSWWEYINHPGKSPMADLRRANGREEPWNVRFWGVGNESWGCGGNMTPEYYANEYKRFATYLHGYGDVRPFRIATGPDATIGNALASWTETVMREAGSMIDGLDMHYYTWTGGWAGRTLATEFTEDKWSVAMAQAMRVDDYIRQVSAIMDRYDPQQRVWLIVGEWGMWHQPEPGTDPGFLYQQNTLRDAVVAGLSFNIFNNHADRVKMANIAQMINVLQAVILTQGDQMIRTPTYHVFDMYKVHQDATLLPITLDAGTYTYEGRSLPAVSASASKDASGTVHITLVNMDPNQARTIDLRVRGEQVRSVSGTILTAATMNAHNTFEQPNAVRPVPFTGAQVATGGLQVTLPAKSVVLLALNN